MSSDFDLLVEDHFRKKDFLGFDQLAGLVEEIMQASTLEEAQGAARKKAEQFLLILPKFIPTEAWGNPDSMEREQITRLFAVIGGDATIEGKLTYLQRIAAPDNKITSPRRIISSLIILESLSAVVESFGAPSAGFVFEGFLAALFQGHQVGDVSAKGNLPIQDMMGFSERDGKPIPISLKLLGQKTDIEGSYTNLVDGIDEFGEMVYIVARKTTPTGVKVTKEAPAEVIVLEQFRFTPDNFLEALYLDARGRGKKTGLELFELPPDQFPGLSPQDAIELIKDQPTWDKKYELLQLTRGYSSRVRNARQADTAAAAAKEAADLAGQEEAAAQAALEADAASSALHEAIRDEWSLLLEVVGGGSQWSISAPQLKTFKFVEYEELGTLPFSSEQIKDVAELHMDKLNDELFELFGATKDLSENINKYFTVEKRASAINSGERAIENTDRIQNSLRTQLAEPDPEEKPPE